MSELETGIGRIDENERTVVPASALSRRRFLGSVGLGAAAAGLSACAKPPPEEIVPYVRRPPEVVPGVASFYATSCTREGYAIGVLAESHEGRPTKLEGHPDHPSSLGALTAREQAAVLQLYDPDRGAAIMHRGDIEPWQELMRGLSPDAPEPAPWIQRHGEGLHLVLPPISSPLVEHQLDRLREKYPLVHVHVCAGAAPPARWVAAKRVFGKPLDPDYDLTRADVIVALDADFLSTMPHSVRLAHDWATGRGPESPDAHRSRTYVVESASTPTGASADEHLGVGSSEVPGIAAALLVAVAQSATGEGADIARRHRRILEQSPYRHWIEACARDLWAHGDRSAVIVGDRQPPEVHALAAAIHELFPKPGATLRRVSPALSFADSEAWDISLLLEALDDHRVDSLFVLGPNPAYTLPRDADWQRRAKLAREFVHLSLYANETTADATWYVPGTHFLEEWGDGRAWDGTVTLRQPLIRPLLHGRSISELLQALLGEFDPQPRWVHRDFWMSRLNGKDKKEQFAKLLAQGFQRDSAAPAESPKLRWGEIDAILGQAKVGKRTGIELEILPDPRLQDGDMANVSWLQELPEPVTKIAWGNAAIMSKRTAHKLAVSEGKLVELHKDGHSVRLPAFIEAAQADDTIVVWHGFGRTGSESVARGVGTDIAPLRTMKSPWWVEDVSVTVTGGEEKVATTQKWDLQYGRDIVLRHSVEEWKKDEAFAIRHNETPPSILPQRLHGSPQWAMAIDLDKCTGCSACVIACQAENNIPVVGKAQLDLGREMQWLRIDRYYEGNEKDVKIDLQPMLCQHCEKAPCEYVCPVNATVHSPDGLNEMIYNRCVGTRFCSNNCPYKVRRFNFYNYNQDMTELHKMVENPDVTVRGRGIMEKCTYCVQRIRRAQIDARLEDRQLRLGEVETACQQTCPPGAIVFGLLSRDDSQVSKLHRSARTYAVLDDQDTRPRTRYLARIDNPNPELEK